MVNESQFLKLRGHAGTLASNNSDSQIRPRVSICVPTCRSILRETFQCSLYEAQDVLVQTNNVDLIDLQPARGFSIKDRWHKRLLFRRLAPLTMNPGLQPVRLTHDYDVLVATCQNIWDLRLINAIDKWKEQCRIAVCWLDEIWATEIAACANLLRGLKKFDHVFVNYHGTVGPLARLLDRPCHYLPVGIDTLRFSPFPSPPDRSIDVYSIGRRCEGIHQVLVRAASQNQLFYIHDSYQELARMKPIDYKQHRDLFANMAKRTKYFLVSPAKMNSPEQQQGQVQIGYRYLEGAAAGAVLVGQVADCEAFRELFPWPDAVVEVRPDGSDTLERLADLEVNPQRVSSL